MSSCFVAIELVGEVRGEGTELEPADLDPLQQHEVERYPRDDARRVADGDEPTTEAQRSQRGFGQVAADGIDHDVGAVRHRGAQGLAEIARPVVDEGARRRGQRRPRAWRPTTPRPPPTRRERRRAGRPPGRRPHPRRARPAPHPACSRATERSVWNAVRWATPNAAARHRRRRPSGMGWTERRGHHHALGEGAVHARAEDAIAGSDIRPRRRPPRRRRRRTRSRGRRAPARSAGTGWRPAARRGS